MNAGIVFSLVSSQDYHASIERDIITHMSL